MYISPFRPLLAYFSPLTDCERVFACVYRGILGDWRDYRRFSVCENVRRLGSLCGGGRTFEGERGCMRLVTPFATPALLH
jgi:hypothetical protein